MSSCLKCGNPTTYDSGFKQECATPGCANCGTKVDATKIDAILAKYGKSEPIPGTETGRIFTPDGSFIIDGVELPAAPDGCTVIGDDDDAGMTIVIGGDAYVVESSHETSAGMVCATMECGAEFQIVDVEETARQAARDYWEDMATHDPSEFECIVGAENIIAMALGQPCNPGSVTVSSLNEWFDLSYDAPEEHLAPYDGESREVDEHGDDVVDDFGFIPTFAYRCN